MANNTDGNKETNGNNYARDTFPFDFSDIDEVEQVIHADCSQAGCDHLAIEGLENLVGSQLIDGMMGFWVVQSMRLRMSGAPPEEGIENLKAAFAAAFYHGAVYARHQMQAAEFKKVMAKMEGDQG